MKKDIYIITNDINDKIYVGQSVNTKERFSKHISDAIHDRDNMLIHKAVREYGKEDRFSSECRSCFYRSSGHIIKKGDEL